MAEHLGKDVKTYAEEYTSFCRELKSFHDIRGTSFNRLPRLHGHEVDLYLLYSLVTSHGGWEKVNIHGEWESLLPYFGIHRLCANGPIALKQIYIRYLDVYERIHFLGEEVDRRESEHHEEDDARNRRKALRLLHATPTAYNASQHVISDHVRNTAGLSTDVLQVTPTERVFLSLLCPLPNEQDFAINVCSLLAMENRRPFPLHQCPRIVDALLAHAGIFSQVDIRDLFTESYRKYRKQNLGRFWRDVVPDADIVQLSEEDLVFPQEDVTAIVGSYWSDRSVRKTPDAIKQTEVPSRTRTLDHLPEEADDASNKVHLVVRPLGSEKPIRSVTLNSKDGELESPLIEHDSTLIEEETTLIEEESQCSVILYENGAGPLSASGSDVVSATSPPGVERAPSCEPNFRNCLAKSANIFRKPTSDASVTEDLQTKENPVIPQTSENLSVDRIIQPNCELFSNEDTAIAQGSSEDTASRTKTILVSEGAVPNPPVVVPNNNIEMETPSQAEANIERKVVAPKNKLPIAVQKPDNPRAIRYWLDQRKAARCPIENLTVEQDEAEAQFESEESDLFHVGREQGVHDALGQRVLQVLNVIRNLSFDDVNSAVLAQSEACMRLLLLAAHARWSCLPQLAFDALSNVALEVNLKDPADCSLSAILLGTVTRGLESSDRFIVLRCMETLGRLAQRGENELLLMASLDSHVYEKLCSYLTIPDVALLIYTLECVYALSSLGQSTCNAFLHCQGALDVLISLLTVEAQSYGSKARILMNVVETVAEGETVAAHAQLNPIQCVVRPTHSNSPAPSAPSTPPPMLLQPVAAPMPASPNSLTKIQPKTNANSRPSTPTQSKPGVVNITQTEKEQIAMQWLRATFESVVGAPSIEQNVLYRQYTAGCSRNGPKQVLGIVQFFSCVRATFGQNVGPFRKQVGSAVEFYFEGISSKGSTTSVAIPTTNTVVRSPTPTPMEVPGSPILKAQLCAPPKATNRKEAPKQSLAHPHLSQALGQGGPSQSEMGQIASTGSSVPPTSSLIKSLLANKVAQRQQQQKLLQQQQTVVMNGPSKDSHTKVKGAQVNVSTPKMNGVCPEMEPHSGGSQPSDGKVMGKGMLADLLEREVKKEPVNGATTVTGKELRISDNGLELVQNDSRGRVAVDMGVVGMNDLGVDLGDGAAAPKAAHLIAQVDDSGHVQIHLEEEAGSAVCNGQSLLDQLEACEVSSSTDEIVASQTTKSATKRPVDPVESNDSPAPKKLATNQVNVKLNENTDATVSDQHPLDKNKDKVSINGGINGIVETAGTVPVTAALAPQIHQIPPATVLGPNTPRTFLILQQQSPQQARLGFPQQGQRLLLAIQRPGGLIQHVAMPANVVAITSNQLQTNGAVVTLSNSVGTNAMSTVYRDSTSSTGQTLPSSAVSLIANGNCVPVSTAILSASSQPISVSNTVSSVVTTASMEGVVTFSGGAVAFPARPTENTARSSSLAESHVTITPVLASSIVSSVTSATTVTTSPAASPATIAHANVTTTPGIKKRNNSIEATKPRGRPMKSKSTDCQPVSSPSPQPVDSSLQYLCEWKDCMRSFKTPHEVYVHACQVHCPVQVEELGCLWERCDGLKRRRFSMMTHLMDRHCNEEMQRLLAARRHQMNTQGKTDIPAPQAPTPHPGYAPHAALHAIKRHAVELMNQKEQEEKEGPVTKSIRLTSALILRNIATHSAIGRRSLQRYENHLASVALSNVESSRTVAQILYELTHQCS
ncbi:AT-rich interactive domain-containing protein 2-like isoform X2 [Daphnia carinata]|uniref:AT-rich interactive domain-containing protein 2-like isoform X2 n=1 Tax=Daphnia carinata TaxID=120202 RepID=UPI002868A052|nr:AT-rich interactive domain-containing protein 2-like isoform X2 [Daphnia carinata]